MGKWEGNIGEKEIGYMGSREEVGNNFLVCGNMGEFEISVGERPRDSNQSTPTPLPHMGYFAIEERE